MARAKKQPAGEDPAPQVAVPADLFAGYAAPASTPAPTPTPEPAPTAPLEPEPTPAPAQEPPQAPVTAASAVVASLGAEKEGVKAPGNGSGTLIRTSTGWVFMDIDGPAVERAVAAAREAQPGITLDAVASLIGGWAHDHGRLFRTVTNIY